MFCKSCGAEISENQDYCLKCGVKKGVGTHFCQNCGNELAENACICVKCGAKVTPSTNESTANTVITGGTIDESKKVTAIVLCLFLGGIGIHNFYLGETKKGIARIVCTCLFGIGCIIALIDLIKMITGSYEVNTEKYF